MQLPAGNCGGPSSRSPGGGCLIIGTFRRYQSRRGSIDVDQTARDVTWFTPYFRSGRNFSAWIGLVPKQHSSGGKDRLGSISKQGDRYLRSLFMAGALAVIRYARIHGTKHRPWLTALLARNGTLKTDRGFPHGMPTTEAATINADLLTFLKADAKAAAA